MRKNSFLPLKISLIFLLILAAILLALLLKGNDFALQERSVTLPHQPNNLQAVLALPEQSAASDKPGVVIFIHGDGEIDATHQGLYRPVWEALALAGFASLSWDKAGVAGAPGNWLHQSMDDRADEVAAAIRWVKAQPDLDGTRIALWGASQAGWVMPKVAAAHPELCFMLAVSPGINWLQQGRFNTLATLHQRQSSPQAQTEQLTREQQVLQLLERNASYQDYLRWSGDHPAFSADRWQFIGKNYRADARSDLARTATPVLLMLGGHDVNVDVADTEQHYRALLTRPGQLTVAHFANATHSMLEQHIESHTTELWLRALFWPRSIFAADFLALQQRFAAQHRTCSL